MKKIIGFENYSIDRYGNIYSNNFKGRKHGPGLLKSNIGTNGYLYVNLYCQKTKTSKKQMVHRLIALSYHGKAPTIKHEASHVDGNKTNNYYRNIKWATHSENELHKNIHGTRFYPRGELCGMAKLSEAQVNKIKILYKTGLHTYKSLGAQFDIHPVHIGRIINNKRWKHLMAAEFSAEGL